MGSRSPAARARGAPLARVSLLPAHAGPELSRARARPCVRTLLPGAFEPHHRSWGELPARSRPDGPRCIFAEREPCVGRHHAERAGQPKAVPDFRLEPCLRVEPSSSQRTTGRNSRQQPSRPCTQPWATERRTYIGAGKSAPRRPSLTRSPSMELHAAIACERPAS